MKSEESQMDKDYTARDNRQNHNTTQNWAEMKTPIYPLRRSFSENKLHCEKTSYYKTRQDYQQWKSSLNHNYYEDLNK